MLCIAATLETESGAGTAFESAEGYGAPAWQILAVRFIALSIQSDVDDRHHPLSDRRLPTRVFGEVICCLRTTAPKVLCPRPS